MEFEPMKPESKVCALNWATLQTVETQVFHDYLTTHKYLQYHLVWVKNTAIKILKEKEKDVVQSPEL